MKLIDKDAVVAEVEKIIPQRTYERETLHSEFVRGQIVAYSKILSFLDTLEVKEVDLDMEINLWVRNLHSVPNFEELNKFARHFFELGLKSK